MPEYIEKVEIWSDVTSPQRDNKQTNMERQSYSVNGPWTAEMSKFVTNSLLKKHKDGLSGWMVIIGHQSSNSTFDANNDVPLLTQLSFLSLIQLVCLWGILYVVDKCPLFVQKGWSWLVLIYFILTNFFLSYYYFALEGFSGWLTAPTFRTQRLGIVDTCHQHATMSIFSNCGNTKNGAIVS